MQLPPKIRNKLLLFGYYQIIGGVIGIVLIVGLLPDFPYSNFRLITIIAAMFLLFLFSIYCGYLLIKQHRNGIKVSMINQYLQLISFAIGGYSYQYFSGLYLTMGFDLTESFTFLFGFGFSSCNLNINMDDRFIQLNFNFVALIVLFMLDKLKDQIKDEQNMDLSEDPESPK